MRPVTRKQAVRLIQALEGPHIHFTAKTVGDDVIGYIDDNERHMEVQYLEDNLGKYIALVLPMETDYTEDASMYLKRWIVNGRHELRDGKIVLSTIFPVLGKAGFEKLLKHALLEIWDMSNIVNTCSKIPHSDGKNL